MKLFGIAMLPVESSQLAQIGYDEERKVLQVEFHPPKFMPEGSRGGVYQYPDVAPELFAEFQAAESKDRFFGTAILPLRIPWTKMRGTMTPEELATTNVTGENW